MLKEKTLTRFVTAQKTDFDTALAEVRNGRKRSHWMWYIFPQVDGLGYSETSRFYSIKNIEEATAYLEHPVLGTRLVEICHELVKLPGNDPARIFGTPDDIKLRSSMTLFALLENSNPVFRQVLDKYFHGQMDEKTAMLLGG